MSEDSKKEPDRPSATGGGEVHAWGSLVKDLRDRRVRALDMGGTKAVDRQESLGKLTVRERLELLIDRGTIHPTLDQVRGHAAVRRRRLDEQSVQ